LFATGVVYTGGKFAACVVDTGGKLPLALLTPVTNLPPVSSGGKFATSINNASEMVDKFAADVVDTGGPPWLANNSANLKKN
jgi:hypothetical protein